MARCTGCSRAPTQKVQAAPAVASQIYLLLIPDTAHRRLLVYPSDRGWRLPCTLDDEEGGWTLPRLGFTTPLRTDVLATLEQEIGLRLTGLHQFAVTQPSTEKPLQICTLENHSDRWQPPSGGRWIEAWELGQLCFRDATEQTAIDSWFAEVTGGGEPLVPWWQPGWFQQAVAWIETELRRQGITPTAPVRVVKSWCRSNVCRVETDMGRVYFKASPPALAHEAALTRWLAEREPSRSPVLLAVDPDRSWTLTMDVGDTTLGHAREVGIWEPAIRSYARLQTASVSRVNELLALGCLDLRPERMAAEVEAFFAEVPHLLEGAPDRLTAEEEAALWSLASGLRRQCIAVASQGIPCALEHGDFCPINVAVGGNGPRFIDWQEGCITHPFFSLVSFLSYQDRLPPEPEAAAVLRDAYLQEWQRYAPLDRSRELFATLTPIWRLYLALQDCGQLATWWKQLGSRPLLPITGAEWSVRSRQRWLAEHLRRLLSCCSDSQPPEHLNT
jgi:hypothetical protein